MPLARRTSACATRVSCLTYSTIWLYCDFTRTASSPSRGASAKDAKVAGITQAYWINFARTGDPNGKGLPKWPAFKDVATGPVLHLSENPAPGDSLGPDRVKLYRALYERSRWPRTERGPFQDRSRPASPRSAASRNSVGPAPQACGSGVRSGSVRGTPACRHVAHLER